MKPLAVASCWQVPNYGSVLQAYATQAALDSLKRGEAHLRQLEHQLGLRSAFHKTYDAIYVIEGLIARGVHTGELLYAADILRSIWED